MTRSGERGRVERRGGGGGDGDGLGRGFREGRVFIFKGGAAGITRDLRYFNTINLTALYGLRYYKKDPLPPVKIISCTSAAKTRLRMCKK